MKCIIVLCIIIIGKAQAGNQDSVLHHNPPGTTVVHTRTIYGGAVGGHPSTGAYSSAQYTQTVSVPVPSRVHSVISTHHPTNYGNNQRDSLLMRQQSGHGGVNEPNVIAYSMNGPVQVVQNQGHELANQRQHVVNQQHGSANQGHGGHPNPSFTGQNLAAQEQIGPQGVTRYGQMQNFVNLAYGSEDYRLNNVHSRHHVDRHY